MQDNRLSEFRQALYRSGFTRRRDAQQELLDALLLSGPIDSFVELTLSPAFRRRWPSAYAALSGGEHNTGWIEGHLTRQVPSDFQYRAAEVFGANPLWWTFNHLETKRR